MMLLLFASAVQKSLPTGPHECAGEATSAQKKTTNPDSGLVARRGAVCCGNMGAGLSKRRPARVSTGEAAQVVHAEGDGQADLSREENENLRKEIARLKIAVGNFRRKQAEREAQVEESEGQLLYFSREGKGRRQRPRERQGPLRRSSSSLLTKTPAFSQCMVSSLVACLSLCNESKTLHLS